jgi:hypothetical protein
VAYERLPGPAASDAPTGAPAGGADVVSNPVGAADERIAVLLNFSGKTAKLPGTFAGAFSAGKLAVSNMGRREVPDKTLEPWEAAVITLETAASN